MYLLLTYCDILRAQNVNMEREHEHDRPVATVPVRRTQRNYHRLLCSICTTRTRMQSPRPGAPHHKKNALIHKSKRTSDNRARYKDIREIETPLRAGFGISGVAQRMKNCAVTFSNF